MGPLDHGILRRARETGIVEVNVQDLRVFTKDRHRTVDDRPFGGGEGMVLKPEPLFEAVEHLLGRRLATRLISASFLGDGDCVAVGFRQTIRSGNGAAFRNVLADYFDLRAV